MQTTKFILQYNIYCLPVDTISLNLPKGTVINTINPHSYCTARNDEMFREALLQSDILLPDGEGIVLAAKVIRGEAIPKIAGSDIHIHLLSLLNNTGGKVFYLGASEFTLSKIKERLAREYPNIQAGTYSPPYKAVFSEAESSAMIDAVNAFSPDVLFVGMTAPKQEKWVYQHHTRLNAGIICSIGAVFDFYAGTVKRPHPIIIKMKLEWLGRLLKEPKRMWRRNFVSTPLFLWYVLIAKCSRKS